MSSSSTVVFQPPAPPRKRSRLHEEHQAAASSPSSRRAPSLLFSATGAAYSSSLSIRQLQQQPPPLRPALPVPLFHPLSPSLSASSVSSSSSRQPASFSPAQLIQLGPQCDPRYLEAAYWQSKLVVIPSFIYPAEEKQRLLHALRALSCRTALAFDPRADAVIISEMEARNDYMSEVRMRARAASCSSSSSSPPKLVTLGTNLSTLLQASQHRIPTFALRSFLRCDSIITAPPALPAASSRHPTLSIQSASGRHAPFHRSFVPLASGLPSHPLLWLTAPKGGCPFVRPRPRGAASRQERRESGQAAQAASSSVRSVHEELQRDAEAERLGRHMCEICGETFAGRLLEHLDTPQHADRQQRQDWTQLAAIRERLGLKRRLFDERWQQRRQQQQQDAVEPQQAGRPPHRESRSASGLCLVYSRHAPPAEWELSLYSDDVVWSSPPHLHGSLVYDDDPLWQLGVQAVHELYMNGRHRQLLYPATQPTATAAAAAEPTTTTTAEAGAEQFEDATDAAFQSCEELTDWPSSPPAACTASLPSAPASKQQSVSGCDVVVPSDGRGGGSAGSSSQPPSPSPAVQSVGGSSDADVGDGSSEATLRNGREQREADRAGSDQQLQLGSPQRDSAADDGSRLPHGNEAEALPHADAAVAEPDAGRHAASDGSLARGSSHARKRSRSAETPLTEQESGAEVTALSASSPTVAVDAPPVTAREGDASLFRPTPTPLPASPSPVATAEAAPSTDTRGVQASGPRPRVEERHRKRLKQWSRLEGSLGAGEATRCSRAGERERSRAQPQQREELLRDAQQFMRWQDARQRDQAAAAAAAAAVVSAREERQRARRKREEAQMAAMAEQGGAEAGEEQPDRVAFLPVLTRRERRWLGLEICAM